MRKGPNNVLPGPSREIVGGWACRALLLSVVAVLIATLFPFQFLPKETAYRRTLFFLLWLNTQPSGLGDFLKNVLLFVPFGFGLGCWLAKKGWPGFWVALAAGTAFSFLVEILQVFLPTRTASWWDVISNSLGSGVGFLIFESVGGRISGYASALEKRIEQFFTTWRIAAGFVAYCGLMLVCSARLQRYTNLTHWQQGDTLFVGNDATNRHSWQGRILRLEMADEIVSPDYFSTAGNVAGRSINKQASEAPHVVLELSAPGSQTEEENSQAEGPRLSAKTQAAVQTGMDSIRAKIPATCLVNDFVRTNRFTLRVLCIPNETTARSFGSIVSLSRDPRYPDFYLNQDRERWVVGIRSVLGGETRYWDLEFSNVPINDRPQEISITYNGSDVVAAVNGKQAVQPLRLNPGASLIRSFKGIGTPNVYGYRLLFDGLVFIPLGLLLALAARKPANRSRRRQMLVGMGFLLPPLALEVVLTLVSSRPVQVENVFLGGCLVLGAFLFVNADLIYTARGQRAQNFPGPAPLDR